jgi:restriction system protein
MRRTKRGDALVVLFVLAFIVIKFCAEVFTLLFVIACNVIKFCADAISDLYKTVCPTIAAYARNVKGQIAIIGPIGVEGFAALVVLVIAGVMIIRRVRHPRWRVNDDSLYLGMQTIVRKHVHTLAIERRIKLVPDKYGVINTTPWNNEVALFIARVAEPYLLSTVPARQYRRSENMMIKRLYYAVGATNPNDIIRAVLQSVIEAEVGAFDATEMSRFGSSSNYTTPAEFEKWCAAQLQASGWDVQVTGRSGDQGVDVRAKRAAVVLIVQCKLYSQPVGNRAVQEAFAGKSFYHAHAAAVVSTAGFTKHARAIAAQTGVHLLTPDQLRSFSPTV